MTRRSHLAVTLASTLLWGCSQPVDGVDGRSLNSVQAEPAGSNCPSGGQKILTGVDADGSGTLEPGEVTQVAYVCNGDPATACTTLQGSVVIQSAADWTRLVEAGCTRITGSLEIRAPGVASLEEPSPLVQVGELLATENAALTGLRLPALAAVDGRIHLSYNAALADLDLPALVTVGDELVVFGSPATTRVNLPALASVGGPLQLHETSVVVQRFPSLATANVLNFTSNPLLTAVELPVLTAAERLDFEGNGAVASLSAPRLATVTYSLSFQREPALAGLDLPALTEVGYALAMNEVAALASLELPQLRSVGTFSLTDAPLLATLGLPALQTAGGLEVTLRYGGPVVDGLETARTVLTAIDLPALTTVTGNLSVSNATRLVRLGAPALASVGGLVLSNDSRPGHQQGSLPAVDLPALATVGGVLGVVGQGVLPELTLPALAQAGAVTIASNARLAEVRLPELVALPYTPSDWPALGTLSIRANPALLAVSAPKLASTAQGLELLDNPVLPALDLPALASIGAHLRISRNGALAAVTLPLLAQVSELTVSYDPALTQVGLPALVTATGVVTFQEDDALVGLDLPSLQTAYALVVKGNAALPGLTLPALTAFHGNGASEFVDNGALASLRLPLLTRANASLAVSGNAALGDLALPMLTSVRINLWIFQNPVLPQCQAEAVAARLLPPMPTQITIMLNDATATCTAP